MSNEALRVSKIKDGTVIDHVNSGYALYVLRVLGITGHEKSVTTVAINVPSNRMKIKDIVKIEGRTLNSREVSRIALLAPYATINIVNNYVVTKKFEVEFPKTLEGIIKCSNPACISNSNEPITSKFLVQRKEPLLLQCYYCRSLLDMEDVLKQF